jgi:hypothetical protein
MNTELIVWWRRRAARGGAGFLLCRRSSPRYHPKKNMMRLALAAVAPCLALAADNVLIRPWGENALRVQVAPSSWALTDALPTAYLPGGAPGAAAGGIIDSGSGGFGTPGFGDAFPKVEAGPVTSGNIKAEMGADGMLSFTRVSDSKVLFKETARTFSPLSSGADSSVTFDFTGTATKLYGMGQNRQDQNGPGMGVNVVGHTYDFQKSISYEGGPSNSLPWILGADPATGFQFGLLFNSPSLGGAVHTATNTTWSIAGDAGNQKLRQQFDFLITTHSADAKPEEKPYQMMEKYVDAVGHARKMPWPGYWHSRNRYASQEELLTAARGFHNRSIPVDVIVIGELEPSLSLPPFFTAGHIISSRFDFTTPVQTGSTGRLWATGASTSRRGPTPRRWWMNAAPTGWRSWSVSGRSPARGRAPTTCWSTTAG